MENNNDLLRTRLEELENVIEAARKVARRSSTELNPEEDEGEVEQDVEAPLKGTRIPSHALRRKNEIIGMNLDMTAAFIDLSEIIYDSVERLRKRNRLSEQNKTAVHSVIDQLIPLLNLAMLRLDTVTSRDVEFFSMAFYLRAKAYFKRFGSEVFHRMNNFKALAGSTVLSALAGTTAGAGTAAAVAGLVSTAASIWLGPLYVEIESRT